VHDVVAAGVALGGDNVADTAVVATANGHDSHANLELREMVVCERVCV
jgi:hypothetical protein